MIMEKRKKQRLPDKNYFMYLGLMAAALILFVGYSFAKEEISFEVELKKPTIIRTPSSQPRAGVQSDSTSAAQDSIETGKADSRAQDADALAVAGTIAGKVPAAEDVDTTSQFFLLIGDSMGEYLRLRLNDYCEKNGHKMQTVIWYSSTTEWYGSCDTLAHYIRKYKPTYILLTLGSNELFIRDIVSTRQKYVEHILRQIGDIPYVWIGPPNWKDDTGINELILTNVGESRYFESKRLKFQRKKDGAHPVKESAYAWMDNIAAFLSNNAAHRVRMERPGKNATGIPHTEILSPKK